MIVRKFMRLLLVPGMAVPLVLVACSSDDNHFLMDTALVEAGLSQKEFAGQIESAADDKTGRSANELSEVKIDDNGFVFKIGGKHAKASMTGDNMIDRALMAPGARKFNGYDITADLNTKEDRSGTSAGKLHAVVFVHPETDDMGPPATDDDTTNHLSFGLWMVEPPEDSADEISVGAFGPHGEIGRVSVENVIQHDNSSTSNEAKFSGPSIGVATKDDESNIFDATVSLTAKLKGTDYSLQGEVKDFDGIAMENRIVLITATVDGKKVVRGRTRVGGPGDLTPTGYWQAGFTSANSIVGSYGFKDGGLHLIGSFGAYKEMMPTQ